MKKQGFFSVSFLLTIMRGAVIYHAHLEIETKKKYYIGVKGKGKEKKNAPPKNKKYFERNY